MGGAERKANLPQEFRNTGWYLKHVQSSASLLTSETPSQGRPQLPYLLTDDLTVPTPTHPNWQDQRWTSESTTSDYFSQDFITGTRLFQLVWNEILWSLSGVCYCELERDRKERKAGKGEEEGGTVRKSVKGGGGREKMPVWLAAFQVLGLVLQRVKGCSSPGSPQDVPVPCQCILNFAEVFFPIICN